MLITKRDQHLEETRKKVIDILIRYYELKTYIKIKEDEIRNLREVVLTSVELIDLYECSEGELYRIYSYSNDSFVEIEVFRNLRREKKRGIKIELIKKDIERYQSALNIKKAIMCMIDDVINNMNNEDKLLIKLCYINRGKDRFDDIVTRFNNNRIIKLTSSRIEQLRNEAVLKIAKRLKNIKIMSYYVIGE